MNVFIKNLQIFTPLYENMSFPENFFEYYSKKSVGVNKGVVSLFTSGEAAQIKNDYFIVNGKIYNSEFKLIGLLANINPSIEKYFGLVKINKSAFFLYLEGSISKTFCTLLDSEHYLPSISISNEGLFKSLFNNHFDLNTLTTQELQNIVTKQLLDNSISIDEEDLVQISVLNEANSN